MKSIRDFLRGKIRRTESADRMRLEEGGDAHAELGACEGTLVGPNGSVQWYERGLVLAGGAAIAYADIARVELEPLVRADRYVDVVLSNGDTKRIVSSGIGGEIVHATLRWIGNAILRRPLAD